MERLHYNPILAHMLTTLEMLFGEIIRGQVQEVINGWKPIHMLNIPQVLILVVI
jgi:hypothetical protein